MKLSVDPLKRAKTRMMPRHLEELATPRISEGGAFAAGGSQIGCVARCDGRPC